MTGEIRTLLIAALMVTSIIAGPLLLSGAFTPTPGDSGIASSTNRGLANPSAVVTM